MLMFLHIRTPETNRVFCSLRIEGFKSRDHCQKSRLGYGLPLTLDAFGTVFLTTLNSFGVCAKNSERDITG